MVGLAICPHCKSRVTPLRGPDGKALCPACNNTGFVAATPTWAAPSGQPAFTAAPQPTYVQAAPTADGAVLALVMGILSLVIPYIGFIFAFIGMSAAKRAMQAIQASGGQLQGHGMAKAGRICAIVSLVIYGVVLLIVLAALVFVLVSNLGAGEGAPDITFSPDASANRIIVVTAQEGLHWYEFEVEGDAGCVLPVGNLEPGEAVSCGNGHAIIRHRASDEIVYETDL